MASTLVLSSFNGAYAEELPDYRLQLSPARQDVGNLKPGETYTGTIKVQNTGKNPFNYRMSISPYTVIDEMYTQDYDQSNQYTDIVEWIEFSKETGSLEPNTQDEITFTIKVPADVPAGGQYAILMAEIVNDENTNQSSGVAAIRRVGMLLYSNVYGSTRKTGSIIENKVPSILFNPPVTATSIVENTGNTHATAHSTFSKSTRCSVMKKCILTRKTQPSLLSYQKLAAIIVSNGLMLRILVSSASSKPLKSGIRLLQSKKSFFSVQFGSSSLSFY